MRPGSPATAILTLASVRCRSLLVNTSEKVVAVVTVNCLLPERGTGLFARVRVGETGQPFGTTTDHVNVVTRETSVSRLMGDAVNRPVMSAMQSGGGGGPPGGIAWEGIAEIRVIAMAMGAVRQADRRESTPRLTARIVLDRFDCCRSRADCEGSHLMKLSP
jgi:hypothetical protein